MTPLRPDRTVLIATLRSAMGPGQAHHDPQHAIDFYRSALTLSWNHMSRVVGTMGAKTITDHGARVAARKYPDLRLVGVSDQGLDFAQFLSSNTEADPGKQLASVEELCISVLEILGELTGDVIVAPLLENLKKEQAN